MSVTSWLVAGLLAIAVPAAAQQPAAQPSQQAAVTPDDDQRGRVAVTTDGDAGLWWLPVADTNGKGKWRGSAQRNSRNTPQGLMNIADFTANVSYGFGDRFDAYAAWDFIERVDRDIATVFVPTDEDQGGIDTMRPYARERWTGNKLGDLRVGGKYAFLSEGAGDPFSLAARVTLNLPTGDSDNGTGQGSVAADLSAVVSRWISNKVVVSGTAGYNLRKNPDRPGRHPRPEQLPLGRRPRPDADAVVADSRRDPGRPSRSRQRGTRDPARRRRRQHQHRQQLRRPSNLVHDRRHLVCEQWLLHRRGSAARHADARAHRGLAEFARRLCRLSRPHRLEPAPYAAAAAGGNAAAADGTAPRRSRRRRRRPPRSRRRRRRPRRR